MSQTSVDKPTIRSGPKPSRAATISSPFMREVIAGMRSWARHTFAKASLLSGLKSLLWVAPLSVVIWIYAEQQVIVPGTITLTLAVRNTDPTRQVRLVDPVDARVTLDVLGTNDNLEHFRQQLASGSAVQIDIPQATLATPGNHTVSAMPLVSDLDVIKSHYITVKGVAPYELNVAVDALKDVELTVEPAPGGKTFATPPVFTPRKVHAMVPESLIKPAQMAGRFTAYAHLEDAQEPLTPGTHDLTGISVSIPFGDSIITAPTTIAAHVEVKRSDVKASVDAIPIWPVYPPTIEDKYKAVYDPQILTKVEITGPEELVNKLKNSTVHATFDVSPDLSGGIEADHEARLHFYDLPPEVHVSSDTQLMIHYHLAERRTTE